MRNWLMATGVSMLAGCSPAQSFEQTLIQQAEKNTRESLKDPDAAQFRNTMASLKGQCVVGEILSKNGFGAYTGWQPFVWTYNRAYLSADDPEDFPFNDARCRSQISSPKDQPGFTSQDTALIDTAYLTVKKKLGGRDFAIKSVTANAKARCVTMEYIEYGKAEPARFISLSGKELSLDHNFKEALAASSMCMKEHTKVIEALMH